MSVQRLTVITYYRTCAVCSFNISVYQNWCALALGVSPLPRVLWAVGGAFPGFENGAWLPVCLLGGPVEDLPVFGTYGRNVYLIFVTRWLH